MSDESKSAGLFERCSGQDGDVLDPNLISCEYPTRIRAVRNTMARAKSPVANGVLIQDVLTPPEAALFLRVPEEALLKSVGDGLVPGRKIGDEWRFSKQGLTEWLRLGGRPNMEMTEGSLIPGTKAAVLMHFGIFRDDNDLEERLAQLRRFREGTA